MSDIGYECGKCGYTPTRDELARGVCPECHPPPPPSMHVALWRAARSLSEALGHLCDPDTEKGSAEETLLESLKDYSEPTGGNDD